MENHSFVLSLVRKKAVWRDAVRIPNVSRKVLTQRSKESEGRGCLTDMSAWDTKGLFWFAIRNPVCCGKIFIPKYKDDESRFVKGSQEALKPENLYSEVRTYWTAGKEENTG